MMKMNAKKKGHFFLGHLNSFCFELLKREKCSHGLNHILLPLRRTGKRKKKGKNFGK